MKSDLTLTHTRARKRSLPSQARVLVLFPGEDWSYVEHAGKKGFIPSPLLRVGDVDLIDYCVRNGVPIAPAANTDSTSEHGRSRELGLELQVCIFGDLCFCVLSVCLCEIFTPCPGQVVRQGIASASAAGSHSVGVQVVKDPQQAIPASSWALLSETERHRQRMLYGIIYSEFIYNKHLWALTQVIYAPLIFAFFVISLALGFARVLRCAFTHTTHVRSPTGCERI